MRHRLEESVRRFGIEGRIYETTALTACRVCRGPIAIGLNDLRRRRIPFEALVGWFYQLNVRDTVCMGDPGHSESRGWGYYWNLDGVLQAAFPDEFGRDLEHRGGRQHFGVEVLGVQPKVHIVKTVGPLSVATLQFQH